MKKEGRYVIKVLKKRSHPKIACIASDIGDRSHRGHKKTRPLVGKVAAKPEGKLAKGKKKPNRMERGGTSSPDAISNRGGQAKSTYCRHEKGG